MARILLHTLVFAPDSVSTAILIAELTDMLMREHQHQVVVLTTTPHYNRSEAAERAQPLRKRWFGLYYTSSFHGARVIHIPMPQKKQDRQRTLDYLWFHFWSLILGILLVGRQDVVLSPSPPLTIGIISWLLAKLKGGEFIYNVQEVYPAYMLYTGALRPGSAMHRVLAGIERFVYQHAAYVTVITEQLRQEVLKVCTNPDKVVLIPNFSVIEFGAPLPRDNDLARELQLVDKFVALYAGNIGTAHSIETLVEAMTLSANDDRIHFLIVGNGVRRPYLEEEVQQRQLHNVTLLPYRQVSEMPLVYATSDIGLVPLKAGAARSATPSKIYTVMAAGLPVLAAVDLDSDTTRLIEDAHCGLVVEPDNPAALAAALTWSSQHPDELQAYRHNALEFIDQHYSRAAITLMYSRLIEKAASR